MGKRLFIKLPIGLAILIMLITAIGNTILLTSTMYVDDDGYCNGNVPCFKKIQWAINNASDGNIIIVYNGTYKENVVIDKEITLKSASTPVIDGNQAGPCITINGDNITIDGFELLNCTYGIYANPSGVDNVTIKNNRIHDIVNTTGYDGVGILFWTNIDGVDFDDIKILNNTIYNNGRQGIFLGSMASSPGISDGNIISGNAIYNNGNDPSPIDQYGIQLSYADYNTIINNDIYGHDDWYFACGIYLMASYNNTILYNNIHNNLYGIAQWAWNRTSIGGNTINYNNFYNNTAWGVRNFDATIVNATSNWWGNLTGPYHPTLNPDGQGDDVSDNVLFAPWLDAPYPGGQLYTDVFIDENGNGVWDAGEPAFNSIQDAINNSAPYSTIKINPGLYSSIVINKPLRIVGDPSIDANGGIGIWVKASDVLIENMIVFNGSKGVYVYNNTTTLQNVTIRNCTAKQNDIGIFLNVTKYSKLVNNNITLNNLTGLYLLGSAYNDIINNSISYNNRDRVSEAGIRLQNSNNNTFSGNQVFNNSKYGVWLNHSNFNEFIGNDIVYNCGEEIGVYLLNSNSNSFISNNVSRNTGIGIYIYDSDYNRFVKNNINENGVDGISLGYFANNNVITGNDINSNGRYGIHLFKSNDTTIMDNTIINNVHGIYNYRSSYNTIERNLIEDNNIFDTGIHIDSGSNNEIHYNCLINNEPQAYDDGANNNWDRNYWNPPPSADYTILGSAGSRDNDPLQSCPFFPSKVPAVSIQGFFALAGLIALVAMLMLRRR